VLQSNIVSKIFSFTDYAYSKQVVEDYPRILAMYKKLLPAIAPFQAYAGVWLVMQAVQESIHAMERQLKQSTKVYSNRGKMQDE
jgi:hypothetical protein